MDCNQIERIVLAIKLNADKVSPMNCDLVMAVRFLYKLTSQEGNGTLLQAYSHDLCEHSTSILTKICGYHEQPHLHTATFAGFNGHLLMAVIRLVILLLSRVIRYRIACLGEKYQDTTAIPTLLKTFALCSVVPKVSDSHVLSLESRALIVSLLNSFTTVPVDMSKEKTTPWQLMLIEVVKYITLAPHTFLPGLRIFSRLIPGQMRPRERNLWSAQLYGIDGHLKEMTSLLLHCGEPRVRQLFIASCHQVARLSAPTAVIVAEAVVQSLKAEPTLVCVSNVAALLGSRPVKAAFLSLVSSDDLRSISARTLASLSAVLLDPNHGLCAVNLPDPDTCAFLMNAVVYDEEVGHFLTVAKVLAKTGVGLSLLRKCLARHKTELCKKFIQLKKEQLEELCEPLVKVSKYLAPSELQELFEGQRTEQLDLGPFSCQIKTLLEQSSQASKKPLEDLDVEWPPLQPLLEQFKDYQLHEQEPDFNVEICKSEQEQVDLIILIEASLSKDFDLQQQVTQVCDEKSLESERQKKKAAKKSLLESKALANKNLISNFKAGGTISIRGGRSVFNRGPGGQRPDLFRSRPPNTSRPPSLHVDDFLVLQSRGQQPTGPTGYNKQSLRAAQELFAEKEAKTKGSVVGFREATKEPVFDSQTSPQQASSRPRAPASSSAAGRNYRKQELGSNNPGSTGSGGRTMHRDRSTLSNGSRGRSHSPSRQAQSGRSSDHRFHPRQRSSGKDPGRRGKDRSKGGKSRSGNLRSMQR